MKRQVMIGLLVVAMFSGMAMGGPAIQYRGPEGSNPYAIAFPGVDGPVGTERLASKSRDIEGVARWEFWWETNRDRFLRRVSARTAGTMNGMASTFGAADRGPQWVDESDVRVRIVKALLERLGSRDEQERAQAAIALGKTRVSAAYGPLKEMLDGGTHSDRRAAALGLGLLGEPVAAPVLVRFASRSGVSLSDRAVVAIALGLLDAPESAPALERMLKESLSHRGRVVADFQVAAITSLGLLGQKSSADLLVRVAATRNGIDSRSRAAALIALGRINTEGVVKAQARGLIDGDVVVRRAAAEALGLTLRADAQPLLLAAFREDPDVSVRSFAAVSMARIGGPNVGNALVGGLHLKYSRALRGFCALGLGILGDRRFAPKLRELVVARDESSLAGAASVALGIMGDRGGIPFLRSVARDGKKNPDLRGYATLALSMMGDRTSLLSLGGILAESQDADLRRAAGLGLGLAGSLKKGPALLKTLFKDTDGRVRGAAISSLKLLPRRSVLGTLVDVATSPGFSRDMRIDAITALGALATRGRPCRLEAVLDGLTYRSLTESLAYTSRQL